MNAVVRGRVSRSHESLLRASWWLLECSIGRWFWIAVLAFVGLALLMRAWPLHLFHRAAWQVFIFAELLYLQFAIPRVLVTWHALHHLRMPRWRRRAVVSSLIFGLGMIGPVTIFSSRPVASLGLVVGAVLLAVIATAICSMVPRALGFFALLPVIELFVVFQPVSSVITDSLVWAGVVAYAIAGAWRWRVLLRREPSAQGAISAWDAALWTAIGSGMYPHRGARSSLLTLGWRWLRTHAQAVQTRSPTQTMAFLLGDPFTPQPLWLHGLAWAWGLALLATLITLATLLHWAAAAALLVLVPLTFAVLISALRGTRPLARVLTRSGGDQAELALLPGFGDAVHMRHTLLRVVLWPTLQRATAVASIAIMACAIAGAPARLLALLAAWSTFAICAGQASLLLMLSQPMVWNPRLMAPWRRIALAIAWLLALIVLISSSVVLLTSNSDASTQVLNAWLFIAVWMTTLATLMFWALRAWRRLHQLPHPFVQS